VNDGFVHKVREAGGEVYGISSEPQTVAGWASAEWALNFETIGDPHHEISGACRERGWLDLYVNERMEFLGNAPDMKNVLRGREMEHPKGYYQPGVLAITQNHRILYRWRAVPTHKNIGGALGRSTPDHVWRSIEANLDDSRVDAALDTDPPLDSNGFPWWLFVALNVASGWFVSIGSLPNERHIKISGIRLVTFVAMWIAAFLYLPVFPVVATLVVWVGFITPKIRWLSNEIQDASDSRSG